MSILRQAEGEIMELVIRLHWVAGEVPDVAVAKHLRSVADHLNDAAMELRLLWEHRPAENPTGQT